MRRITRQWLWIVALAWAIPGYADLIDELDLDAEPTPTPSSEPVEPTPAVPPQDTTGNTKTPEKNPNQQTGVVKPPVSTPQAQPTPPKEPKSRIKETDDQIGLAPKPERPQGKDSDADEPVRFTSQGLKGKRTEGFLELLQDVEVVQGTMRLLSDKAIVYFNEETNEVEKIVAEGNVKVFRKDEETGDEVKAFGNKMTFFNGDRKVLLTGNARLWNGPDLVKGKEITYELDSGWVWADKVEGYVNPGQQ